MSELEPNFEMRPQSVVPATLFSDRAVQSALVWGLEQGGVTAKSIKLVGEWEPIGSSLWINESTQYLTIRQIPISPESEKILQAIRKTGKDALACVENREHLKLNEGIVQHWSRLNQLDNIKDTAARVAWRGFWGWVFSPAIMGMLGIQDPLFSFAPAILWAADGIRVGAVDALQERREKSTVIAELVDGATIHDQSAELYREISPFLKEISQLSNEDSVRTVSIKSVKYQLAESVIAKALRPYDNDPSVRTSIFRKMDFTDEHKKKALEFDVSDFIVRVLKDSRGTVWDEGGSRQIKLIADVHREVLEDDKNIQVIKRVPEGSSKGAREELVERRLQAMQKVVSASAKLAEIAINLEAHTFHGNEPDGILSEVKKSGKDKNSRQWPLLQW